MSNELPKGWVMTMMGEVSTLQAGVGFPPSYQGNSSGTYPFAKVGDIARAVISGSYELSVAENYVSESQVKKLNGKIIPVGSIAFPKIGAAIACERRALVTTPCLLDNNCFALIPNQDVILQQYLFFLMRHIKLSPLSVATTVPSLRKSDVENLEVALPPLPEQKRIVKKLESLQARSKRAREALEAIPPLIEKFHQSVLASAFRGDLTKEWREKNKDKIEPASELLKRIRVERRKKWEEEQMKKFEAAGKVPKDDKWKEKYKEPVGVDAEGLGELPEGWCWQRISDLFDLIDGDRGPNYPKSSDYQKSGHCLFLSTKNVREFGFQFDDVVFISEMKHKTLRNGTLLRGDLVITTRGTLGNVAYYDNFVPYETIRINSGMLILRSKAIELVGEFLKLFIASPLFSRQLTNKQSGSAQPQIPAGVLKDFLIPVPPFLEQLEIARKANEVLASVTQIFLSGSNLSTRLTELDQSILAKAFRGELARQDPTEEPAHILLERIKKEPGGSNLKSQQSRSISAVKKIKVVELGI